MPFETFAIFDGTPLIGATPSFVAFVDAAGDAVTPPAIVEIGGGLYGFEVADGVARAYLIETGADPAFLAGCCGDVVAFGIYDTDFQPKTGAAPAFTRYADPSGAGRLQPTIAEFGGGLYGFVPNEGDREAPTVYLINTGQTPEYLAGVLEPYVGGSAPIVSNVTPAPGTPITAAAVIGVDVTDDASLRRVLVTVAFPSLGRTELAHDGDGFTQQYGLSRRDNITGGYRYALQRQGGWPASPRLLVYAVDADGEEA